MNAGLRRVLALTSISLALISTPRVAMSYVAASGGLADGSVVSAVTMATSAAVSQTPDAVTNETVLPQPLRPYIHLFIAFAVTWLLIFLYAVTVARRLRDVEQEADALRG